MDHAFLSLKPHATWWNFEWLSELFPLQERKIISAAEYVHLSNNIIKHNIHLVSFIFLLAFIRRYLRNINYGIRLILFYRYSSISCTQEDSLLMLSYICFPYNRSSSFTLVVSCWFVGSWHI